MLTISGLTKTYRGKTRALDSVDLRIEPGLFGLLGPNGAGKTTLMRILATLLLPESGTVVLDDVDFIRRPERARPLIGYLPQEFGTYGNLTTWEYLDYLGALSGLHAAERKSRIEQLLASTNLNEHRNRPTRALSGGMRRRLGVAQALLNEPRLLIVDEPTAGLDPEERIRLRNLLVDLSTDRTVLLSTHIVEDIAQTCSRLAILSGGQVAFSGTPVGLAERSRGRVWSLAADDRGAAVWRTKGAVTACVRNGDHFDLRLVSPEQPATAAVSVTPTLEDAYLDLMGGGRQ